MTKAHLKSLTRLAAVYKIIEHTRGLSLDRASMALYEAELLIEQQRAVAQAATLLGHDWIAHEDPAKWLLCESQIEITMWNRASLEPLRAKCEEQKRQTANLYRESLLQFSQIDTLVEKGRIASEQAIECQRRKDSDDRYLAQLRWLARQEACRMKTS